MRGTTKYPTKDVSEVCLESRKTNAVKFAITAENCWVKKGLDMMISLGTAA